MPIVYTGKTVPYGWGKGDRFLTLNLRKLHESPQSIVDFQVVFNSTSVDENVAIRLEHDLGRLWYRPTHRIVIHPRRKSEVAPIGIRWVSDGAMFKLGVDDLDARPSVVGRIQENVDFRWLRICYPRRGIRKRGGGMLGWDLRRFTLADLGFRLLRIPE